MCGELEDNSQIGTELLEQVRAMSQQAGIEAESQTRPTGPRDLEDAERRGTYMSELFDAGLRRILADLEHTREGEVVDAVACQAIAFARLAGFMAAQLPPEADLYRAVIEAMTDGHAEIAQSARRFHSQGHRHHHHHHHHHH